MTATARGGLGPAHAGTVITRLTLLGAGGDAVARELKPGAWRALLAAAAPEDVDTVLTLLGPRLDRLFSGGQLGSARTGLEGALQQTIGRALRTQPTAVNRLLAHPRFPGPAVAAGLALDAVWLAEHHTDLDTSAMARAVGLVCHRGVTRQDLTRLVDLAAERQSSGAPGNTFTLWPALAEARHLGAAHIDALLALPPGRMYLWPLALRDDLTPSQMVRLGSTHLNTLGQLRVDRSPDVLRALARRLRTRATYPTFELLENPHLPEAAGLNILRAQGDFAHLRPRTTDGLELATTMLARRQDVPPSWLRALLEHPALERSDEAAAVVALLRRHAAAALPLAPAREMS